MQAKVCFLVYLVLEETTYIISGPGIAIEGKANLFVGLSSFSDKLAH